MRHDLVPPGELAVSGMKGDDGVGIGIVAFAVITQNVERYLQYVAADSDRPSFEMMNTMAYGETSTQRDFAATMSAMCGFGRRPYQRMLDRLLFNAA